MTISKGREYWGKLSDWALREGRVAAELARALNELIATPESIPEDREFSFKTLFQAWFLLDRRLAGEGATPVELFLRWNRGRLPAQELAVFRRFRDESCLGIFKVERLAPGEGMDLRLMPDGKVLRVADDWDPEKVKKGRYLLCWLLPYRDHWFFTGLGMTLAEESAYLIERGFADGRPWPRPGECRARAALPFVAPPVDWEKQGLARIKARLSMLLQRWGVDDITVSTVEETVSAALKRDDQVNPMYEAVLSRAPSQAEAAEAGELLTAWWKLAVPAPEFPTGPKETMLLEDFQVLLSRKLGGQAPGDEGGFAALADAAGREWLDAPQKELGGRTPREVIIEERKALGNPSKRLRLAVLKGAGCMI